MHSQHFLRCLVVLAGLLYSLAPSTAHAQDAIFADSYELPFNFPANDAEAARFLNQATFGATAADISAVRQQSVAVWLESQLNSGTTTLSRPWLEAYAASLPSGSSVSRSDRIQRWYDVATNAPDQVRQRAAWALGQIVIASDADAFLFDKPIQMAEWNDIIVRNALGNYRQLMREVTFSPMMGRYLTTLRNRKFELVRTVDAAAPGGIRFTAGNSGVQPDENYAREVMQLFSIGLLVRGNDFYTTFPDASNPNPGALRTTYTEDDISGLARFFTGLSHDCTQGASVVGGVTINRNCGVNDATACTGIACRFTAAQRLFNNDPPGDIATPNSRGLEHPDWYKPMVCYPRYNDNGLDTSGNLLETDSGTYSLPPGTPTPDKTLVLGANGPDVSITVPPSFLNSVPLNCHQTAVNNGNPDNANSLSPAEQQACITYCESSIDTAIDALFNHPNTPVMVARTMIQRLVTSNPSPAYVQRVVAAFVNNGAGVRGDMKAVVRTILLDAEARRPFNDPATNVNFGKVREPILKQIALWRHFGGVSPNNGTFPGTNPQGGAANPFGGQPSIRRWGASSDPGQGGSPSDIYQQRPLGAPSVFNFYEPDYRQPGQVTAANLFSPELQIIHEVSSINAANDLFGRICTGYSNCDSGNLTVPAANNVDSRAYFPVAALDAIPAVLPNAANVGPPALADDMALINFFNTRMMGGTMSGADITTFSCGQPQTGMKWQLMNVLRCAAFNVAGAGINEALISGITATNQAERERRKALYMMHLVAISPEYNTQR
jgi:uncharacterized protein (DUF1800 family)